MPRRIDRSMLVPVLLALGAPSGAQTIADYSRAQRALLEATMAQAAARSAALGASSPAPASSSPAAPPPAAALGRRVEESAEAFVSVGGVFESPARILAEVSVNGAAYLLAAGQPVPGTAWRVDDIAVDRVVLSRPRPDAATHPEPPARSVRVLALPAPRWGREP
jgi:type IV pilus biogenesis protein PilP